MRTSKVSQDTTRIFNAISPNTLTSGRSTRSAKRLASFALGYNGETQFKQEEKEDNVSELSATPDIEDAVLTTRSVTSASRKRKLGASSPVTASASAIKRETTRVSPRKVKIEPKDEEGEGEGEEEEEEETSPVKRKAKAKPKKPARRQTSPGGTVTVEPPSNWSEIYDIVKAMRQRNPTAPVDTMGCEDLYWRGAPAKEKRYHTLTALMLSSQTKDTVTAVAMQRLHRELLPESKASASSSTTTTTQCDAPFGDPDKPEHQSQLTVANILASDATHLDHLIGKVGFHNNKTKYIKQTAAILAGEYDSDIPTTIEGLVGLPGVGPKMAYLCMSAAWGEDHGIGVDVHVHRITNLWGWHATKGPEDSRLALQAWLPRDRWHEINKLLVGLGQTVCLPVARRCGDCDLAGTGLCKAEVRGWKPPAGRMRLPLAKAEPLKIEVGFDADADGQADRASGVVLKTERDAADVEAPPIKEEDL